MLYSLAFILFLCFFGTKSNNPLKSRQETNNYDDTLITVIYQLSKNLLIQPSLTCAHPEE